MIRAVLADDHAIVRRGLRALLESEGGCEVVGEAADGLTTVELITQLTPDVAILDLQMPDLDGIEVARRVRDKAPATRVIILSMYGDEPHVVQALRHGVVGYVLKGAATTDLTAALQTVMAGKVFLSDPLSERAIASYAARAQEVSLPIDRYDMLTDREREVLQLAAQGMTNTEIGVRLAISPRTVETHRINLLRKLSLTTQTELIFFALGRGLLPTQP
jgi:two-component system, NarL family, response regulator NreC